MRRRHRFRVAEGEDFVVLVKLFGGDFPVYDFAENTATHGDIIPYLDGYGETPRILAAAPPKSSVGLLQNGAKTCRLYCI